MNPVSVLFFIIGIGIASISKPLNINYGFIDSYWPALVGLIVASGYWIYDHALKHSELISRGTYINHWKAGAIRFALASAYIIPINSYNWNWVRVIDLYLFGICFFGLLFNLCLNHFRDLPFDYLAKSGNKRAITDRVFGGMKHGGLILYGLEILGMIATGYVLLSAK